ncbi:hypothetical protein ABTX81_12490 [Kitasatospora sp. NPDC097605]|uniref:hypothetical protein n=1 Tax=Kitasatospora sp. NPDC097605 TaxID=3157226 RepID=UPI00332FE30B
MTETTEPFRPPRGAAMTRMALSVLTPAAAAATAEVPGRVPERRPGRGRFAEREPGRFTERGAWGLADDVRSFTVRLAVPGAAASATGTGAAGPTCGR